MPRERVPVVERARADLDAGRPWKARDRLHGYLHQRPTDQDALSLLGEVYLTMGDTPAAGRALLLTERDDPEARAAIEAFETRYGSTAARIQALGVRTPFAAWPPLVQERLGALREVARAEGMHWIETRPGSPREFPPGRWWEEWLALGGLVGLFVLPWIAGLIAIFALLFGWIR